MELLVLILIGLGVGYFLARSRFSQPIDETAEKMTETSKGWWSGVKDWWNDRFGRNDKVVDAKSVNVSQPSKDAEQIEEVKPAEKRTSRRKSEENQDQENPLEMAK